MMSLLMVVEECSLILSLQELRDALCIVGVLGDGFIVGAVLVYSCEAGSIVLEDFHSG